MVKGEEVLDLAHMDVESQLVAVGTRTLIHQLSKTVARGASDDKGPTTACYYGLKIIKELGTQLKSSFHRQRMPELRVERTTINM